MGSLSIKLGGLLVDIQAAPKSMSLVDLDYQGKRLRGYMLDESHGRPVGTILSGGNFVY